VTHVINGPYSGFWLAAVTTEQKTSNCGFLQLGIYGTLAAVDVSADFSSLQFLAAGSFTAALWESSESASAFTPTRVSRSSISYRGRCDRTLTMAEMASQWKSLAVANVGSLTERLFDFNTLAQD